MKPVGQKPGCAAAPASQSDGSQAARLVPSPRKPSSRTTGSARIDEIVEARPVAVHQTAASRTAPIPPVDWADVRRRLASADEPSSWPAIVSQVLKSAGVPAEAQLHSPDKSESEPHVASVADAEGRLSGTRCSVRETVRTAMARGRTETSDAGPDFSDVCSPCGGGTACLQVRVPASSVHLATLVVEYAVACLDEASSASRAADLDSDCRHLAALVDLQNRTTAQPCLQTAMNCLAEELQRLLGASVVFVGLCQEGATECRLAAVSGSVEVDSASPLTFAAENVLQEALVRRRPGSWPAEDAGNRHALLCHAQLAELQHADAILSVPLFDRTGNAVGAVVAVTDSSTPVSSDVIRRFFSASQLPLAETIQTARRSTAGVAARLLESLRRTVRSNAARMLGCILLLAATALLVPVDYQVECRSELQPVARRFIAAPFDAPLRDCFVEPGDVVEAGQVLAELDGRELRWELAGVRADLGKASREHDTFLSEQEFGKAAIARHEQERLQNRASLLTDRTRSLAVTSPVAGIVVAGDLMDSVGVPLDTGQTLFEVAPLDELLVEVLIPEDDIRHVRTGMTVELQLDARPAETLTATITRIFPKAELREHENVFIAEAQVSEHRPWLRPGMRGEADISTGSRALGWNLFHKPMAHLCGWLGW